MTLVEIEYMLRCINIDERGIIFNSLIEQIISNDFELTLRLIEEGAILCPNGKLSYNINILPIFLENEKKRLEELYEFKFLTMLPVMNRKAYVLH